MNLHLLGDIILPYEVNNNLQYSILSRMSDIYGNWSCLLQP